ncbi:hypothetical protein CC86DRAFT_381083 [Ophiobolus disseminans]|uniref:Uncharacterized protein n=1 Tax=Ophiobolus disseminans TaxID=1469910 RepID=A0A6A7A622_9PLEO|nr:hypothetical protein CC86DRAFT_381083 [Ophiobolus disseminans]
MDGGYDDHNTVYALTVYCPPRPSKYLPAFLTRTPVRHSNTGATYTIMPDNMNPNLDCFEEKHLDEMATKVIKIKYKDFPIDMRCVHIKEGPRCDQGCYFLEKGGDLWRSKCRSEDCKGHVYEGPVQENEEGVSCFGKSGERM